MSERRIVLPRRVLILGGALGAIGVGQAGAQPSREDRFLGWVHRVEAERSVVPVYDADSLGFPTNVVAGRQIVLTRGGVQRSFTVISPFQPDRVVLATSNPGTRTIVVHRTDVDLRRAKSARSVGGKVSSWSGRDCDADFAEQVDYWIAEPGR
ncbi:MAG: hypothetical protein AB7G10_24475 [Reyranellaceae bacterium]